MTGVVARAHAAHEAERAAADPAVRASWGSSRCDYAVGGSFSAARQRTTPHAHRASRGPDAIVSRHETPHLPSPRRDGHFRRPDLAVRLAALHAFAGTAGSGENRGVASGHPRRSRRSGARGTDRLAHSKRGHRRHARRSTFRPKARRRCSLYRVDAMLSDTDGRLLWRRFEDQFERSTEALFDKLARVLKR